MPRPKRDQPNDLPAAILSTAWQQIRADGAAALSLRSIARELNITAPAIYHYYPNRDELVTALIVDAFSAFADALEAARDMCPVEDHAGRLRAICGAYREWALGNPQKYILIFGTPIPGYRMAPETGLAARRSFLALMGVIGEGYRAGIYHLPPGYRNLAPGLQAQYEALIHMGMPYTPVVIQLALAVWSWVHGLTSLELYGYFNGFLAGQTDEFIRLETERMMLAIGLQ